MNIKILQYGYQRNGVCGDGFHYFKLQWGKGDDKRILFATLTNSDDLPGKFNGSCRVINPENLDEHWRGDEFEHEIRKLHKQWYD